MEQGERIRHGVLLSQKVGVGGREEGKDWRAGRRCGGRGGGVVAVFGGRAHGRFGLLLHCDVRRGCGLAESSVFGQTRHGGEGLAALGALDLHPAVGVHALVPAEVGELGVALEADFAAEGLDGTVDVRVLLEAARGGERLATFWAGVRAGADVVGADVALKIARVGEDLKWKNIFSQLPQCLIFQAVERFIANCNLPCHNSHREIF